jgi:hypothetical protein
MILSFSCSFELFLALLCHFAWLFRFLCRLLAIAVFLLLDGLFELFLTFWVVLDLNFKLCAFVVNGLIKEEIVEPSSQFLSLIVMS